MVAETGRFQINVGSKKEEVGPRLGWRFQGWGSETILVDTELLSSGLPVGSIGFVADTGQAEDTGNVLQLQVLEVQQLAVGVQRLVGGGWEAQLIVVVEENVQ